jgi:plastocyanin
MRKLLIAVLVTALAGALAATAFAARTVKVGDNYFVRDNGDQHAISVSKGTRVVFRWVGDAAHNVAATSGPETFRSKVKGGGSYRHRFDRKGTYKLVCEVHPTQMKLTVRVK